MCGICGEIRFDGAVIDQYTKDSMMDAISARGPDNSGHYSNQSIFLGHHRLSIIDTSDKSNQPMVDEQLSLIIVFNGVIYNYVSLRKDLEKRGYVFESSGDTEVILKAYHFYGEKCVEYLDGVFAFCIYDLKNKKTFIARDRFGIKPMYYKINKKYFSFSSSMQSLISKDIGDINQDAINYHFFLHSVVPAPHTLFDNIFKLKPGHIILINNNGQIESKKYYSIDKLPITTFASEGEIIEAIDYCLLNAIRKRLSISDVPVGILLSGGLDSSLIAAIASRHKLAEINTFSIGFQTINQEQGDEFFFSDLVSKNYSTNHNKIKIDTNELFDNLDKVIGSMPEPMSSQDASAFFLLAREVAKKQKVVLSGQGADELFGGYPWYMLMSNEQHTTDIQKFENHYLDRTLDDFKNTISSDYASPNNTTDFIRDSFNVYDPNLTFLDKLLRFDISHLIVDDPIKRVDSMTMAWGLETRVPFLDQELIEMVCSVSSIDKIKNNGKYYLKKLAMNYLAPEVINRKKFHFPVPPLKILDGKILDFTRETLCSKECKDRGILCQKNIRHLLNNPNENYTRLDGNKLWHLAVFERWFQVNLDKKNPPFKTG
tara:strand:- start:635 stop:2434 length:1800 start_codon:yes stop_codon:yes gene_type:complete